MKSRESSNPLSNLFAFLSALFQNGADPIATIDELLKRPKDEHGNVLIGIDDKNFKHWNAYLQDAVPLKVFGPIVILTNPHLIKALLSKLKNAPDQMNGNASSDLVGKLVGTDNIFSATDPVVHSDHKAVFKSHLQDQSANIRIAGPIIEDWLTGHIKNKTHITEFDLELLCSRLLVRFLLDEDSSNNKAITDAVIQLKKHFIQLATLERLQKTSDDYQAAGQLVKDRIKQLYQAEHNSYPCSLVTKYSSEEAVSHIVSLMMVGFDNLRSVMQSVLVSLAGHPSERHKLAEELTDVDGVPYVPVNQHDKHAVKSSQSGIRFFKESTRLVPPVWLQHVKTVRMQ